MQNVYFANEIETQALDGGCTRRVLAHNAQLMIVEVGFQQGNVGAAHAHPHTQATYVKKGKFRFTIEDREAVVGEGDSLIFPNGILHGTLCLEEGVLIDVFTPQREDFL